MASQDSSGSTAAPPPVSITELQETLRNVQPEVALAENVNAELRQRVEALESELNRSKYHAALAEGRYKARTLRDDERFHRHAARLSNRRKRNMTAVKEELEKRVKRAEEDRELAKKAAGDAEDLRKRMENIEMERDLATKAANYFEKKAADDSEILRKRVEKAEVERDLAMKTAKHLEEAQKKLQAKSNHVSEPAENVPVNEPAEQRQKAIELKAKLEKVREMLKEARAARDTAERVVRSKKREHTRSERAWNQERIALKKSGDKLMAKIVTVETERDLARGSPKDPGESRQEMELRWEKQHDIAIARETIRRVTSRHPSCTLPVQYSAPTL
ncbi:uncharacterized protein BDZ99DRAFT_465154 [Mytilinidion resinicola]|uniref:Uncharacterized protein n=1 Tax=Mytilinidion resinicola TaxID=574789 RepID=A0A6A6YF84_9PEZI|nr:uncharacterized protein BDZ99DRAFT_465154 [Mytilinidion resinicola]KAF2807238.1 hypothetical protein BDZ99DRAFT_465154 [Mytilinidion resinicola]